MRKISTFLLAISFAIAVISSTSCKKEDAIPAPSTNFDKTQIEAKTYNLGDSVKADIEITPNRPLKEIKVVYSKLISGNNNYRGFTLSQMDLQGKNEKFIYPLRFKLDDQFKGDTNAWITISAEFSIPDEGGRTGVHLSEFYIKINQ